MARLSELMLRIDGDPSGAKRALSEINRELAVASKNANASTSGFRAFGQSLSSIGQTLAIGVTLPIAGFATAAVRAAGDIEALKLGLNSITKSAAETERQFNALRAVAKLPGLGLEEAVRGATNLQALGFSFEKSRQILLNFGNALASVGRGRDDLQEVIRQLGQLGARGQVTADNLRPIIERVPQVAAIIKREFGGDALGNPAETFKKLGVSSQEFIDVITRELGKIPPVTGGIKNDFENLSDSVKIAMADAGNALAPFAKRLIDDFAVPAIANLSALAVAFKELSPGAQNATIAVGAFAAGLPLAITGIAAIIEKFTALAGVLGVGGGGIAAGLIAVTGALAINSYQLGELEANLDAAIKRYNDLHKSGRDTGAELQRSVSGLQGGWRKLTAGDLEKAKVQFDALPVAVQKTTGEFRAFSDALGVTVKVLTPAESNLKTLTETAKKSKDHIKAIPFLEKSEEGRILAAQVAIVKARYDDLIRSVAKFREQGGQQSIFDVKAPEGAIGKVTDAIADLETQTKGYLSVMGDLAAATNSVPVSMFNYAAAWDAIALASAKGRQAFDTRDMEAMSKKTEAELKKSEKVAKEFGRQVSLVVNDVSRNITDLIFKGGKFKDVMVDALESVAKALVRLAIEKTLTGIATKLSGLLTAIPGLGKALGGLFGGAAGGVAGSVAGQAAGGIAGGVAGNTVGSAVGSVAGAGISTAAGIGGQAAGAAAQVGISAVAGIVTGAISAVSGVIGNFQMAGMNKSLDLIEKATRYSEAHLLHLLEKNNEFLPQLANIHDRLMTVVGQGVGVYNAAGDGGLRLAGGGGVTVIVNGAGDPETVARLVVQKLQLAGA